MSRRPAKIGEQGSRGPATTFEHAIAARDLFGVFRGADDSERWRPSSPNRLFRILAIARERVVVEALERLNLPTRGSRP